MMNNPFEKIDQDKSAIWEMLVKRDILAFTGQNWSMVSDDFCEDEFLGINANFQHNPDEWKPDFPDIESYKTEWLRQARAFKAAQWMGDAITILFQCTSLEQIDINGNRALAHKKFKGNLSKANGEKVVMNWQSLYRCDRIDNSWKITGFTGYMPYQDNPDIIPATKRIQIPDHAKRRKASGPYSPVLIITPGNLIVISGQAAIDRDGKVIGKSIEEQAAYTLDNCLEQLASVGCSFDDVFKVNVYLKQMDDWSRFNELYKTYFKEPLPVRTTVQAGLLGTLLVEIELWANK